MKSLEYQEPGFSKKGVLLWDIDGTLIEKSGANKKSRHHEVLGVKEDWFPDSSLQGLSDWEVLTEIGNRYKISSEAINLAFNKLLVDSDFAYYESYKLCNGVNEDLFKIISKDWELGILTGNTENRTLLKLNSAGIEKYFDSEYFFTCRRKESRIDIGLRAKTKLLTKHIVLIGDTPRDIELAKIVGWKIISVTTGNFDYESLINLNPDFLLNNCGSELYSILEKL